MAEKTKHVIYDRTETAPQSILADAFTMGGLVFCIWFSNKMGGGMWEFVTLGMFALWVLAKMPWERATRTTKINTKAEAREWAEALPDDA